MGTLNPYPILKGGTNSKPLTYIRNYRFHFNRKLKTNPFFLLESKNPPIRPGTYKLVIRHIQVIKKDT